ncbi:MAG TPA: hypothetical protein VHE13_00555 [Opitutus sp.]|nr:hypothetical protein [Opitutus sp.]
MKPSLAFLPLLAAGFGLLPVRAPAQSPAVPETSRIVFENDKVRVVEYHTNAGTNICGLGLHTHPAHVYIMLTDARLRLTGADGKEEIVDAKAGEVGWEDAVTHRAENLDGKNAGCYLIEFKDAHWKPSTGLSP